MCPRPVQYNFRYNTFSPLCRYSKALFSTPMFPSQHDIHITPPPHHILAVWWLERAREGDGLALRLQVSFLLPRPQHLLRKSLPSNTLSSGTYCVSPLDYGTFAFRQSRSSVGFPQGCPQFHHIYSPYFRISFTMDNSFSGLRRSLANFNNSPFLCAAGAFFFGSVIIYTLFSILVIFFLSRSRCFDSSRSTSPGFSPFPPLRVHRRSFLHRLRCSCSFFTPP